MEMLGRRRYVCEGKEKAARVEGLEIQPRRCW